MPDLTFLIIAGSFLIILGFFLVASGMTGKEELDEERPAGTGKETRVKGGGVIFIGPVPLVFGTDKRYALLMMILAIVLMLLAITFLK
ncbi:MAG: TIGR00304 family protein [Candidatus Methanoperedens sp.]|nr:TIGR00304 family protein [Candidatus Methanoperedens sp.]MCZ7404239.1 TIGR00304 family protein [Candidatus Methanoperedens sp.]